MKKNKDNYIPGQQNIFSYDESDFSKSKINCTIRKNKYSSDYLIEKKKSAKNLAPFIHDWLSQKEKNLNRISYGTGRGKSYSINIVNTDILGAPELYEQFNHIFYIVDRKGLVKEEYQDFCTIVEEIITNSSKKACNRTISKEDALRILSNRQCLIEHFDVFKEITKQKEKLVFTNSFILSDFDKLMKQIKDAVRSGNESKISEDLEKEFRRVIKNTLKNDNIYKEIKDHKKRLEYLKTHEFFKLFIELYSNALIFESKLIYLTLDKWMYPFDSIVGGTIDLTTDPQLTKYSYLLFDEGDTICHRMLSIEATQQANSGIELIRYVRLLSSHISMPFHKEMLLRKLNIADNQHIKQLYDDVEKLNLDLLNKSSIWNSFVDATEGWKAHWMFIRNNTTIPLGANQLFIDIDQNNGVSKITRDKTENTILLEEYVYDLEYFLESVFHLIRQIAHAYHNQGNNKFIHTIVDDINTVASEFGINDNDKMKETICRFIEYSRKRNKSTVVNSDYFYSPSALICAAENHDNHQCITLNRYSLSRTPESIIATLLSMECEVGLSSATINNKSVFRNFEYSWEPLASRIYKNKNEESKRLEREYQLACDANKDKIIVSTEYSNFSNIEANEIKLSTIFGDDMKKLLERLKAVLPKNSNECDDNSNYFQYKRYLEMIINLLEGIEKEVHGALFLLNKHLKLSEVDGEFGIVHEIFKLIQTHYPRFQYHIADSEHLDKEVKSYQANVKNGNIAFLITTFATAEKGLNICVSYDATKGVVVLNDRGKDSDLKKKNLKIDNQFVYMEVPSNITPAIEIDKEISKIVVAKIIADYYNNKLLIHEDITEKEYFEIMQNILNTKKYPFRGYKKTQSYIAAVLSKVIQVVGRISRCTYQPEHCYIRLSGRYSELFSGMHNNNDIFDYIDEDEYEVLPFKVKATLDHLFDLNKVDKHSQLSKHGRSIKDENDRSNQLIATAIDAMFNEDSENYGKFELYQPLQDLRSASITKEEYQLLDGDSKKCRVRSSKIHKNLKNGYSYEMNGVDSYQNPIVGLASTLGRFTKEISLKEIGLLDWQMYLLEQKGFSFDFNKDYVLTPSAFMKFIGNCGESIGEYYFKEFVGYCNIKHLEDGLIHPCTGQHIYERMDYIIEQRDSKGEISHIIVVDFKYFSKRSEMHDDYITNAQKYARKLEIIQQVYDNIPILGLELNTRYNQEYAGNRPSNINEHIEQYDNNRWIFRYHNLYDENGIFSNIISELIKTVEKYFLTNLKNGEQKNEQKL